MFISQSFSVVMIFGTLIVFAVAVSGEVDSGRSSLLELRGGEIGVVDELFTPKNPHSAVVAAAGGDVVDEWRLLQADECDSIDPFTGTIMSSDYIFWVVENACLLGTPAECFTASVSDCATACENDRDCASADYNYDDDECCISSQTLGSLGTQLQSPCPRNDVDYWQKNCPDDQDLISSYCPALACGPTGVYADTSVSVRLGGVWKSCRCPGDQVKCGTTCMDIDDCGSGICDVEMSGVSGVNAGALNADFTFRGLYDYTPYYQKGTADIYLWSVCQFGAWVITTSPGDLSTLAAYVYSTAFEAQDINGPWNLYDDAGYFEDTNAGITCQ